MGRDSATSVDQGYEEENMIEAVVLTDYSKPASAVKEFAEVRAPASLPPGYELTVEIDGSNWVLLVPEQGAQEGEIFRGEMLRKTDVTSDEVFATKLNSMVEPSDPHNVPKGHWRDELCDCCIHGFFHLHFWSAYFCRPIALGQVQNRMNLTVCGERRPSPSQQGNKTLSIMIGLTIAMWTIGQLVGVIAFAIAIFLVIATMQTRANVRRQYNIPESASCKGCEDCCCSFWCGCCVLAQMSRHTVDYEKYHPVCCTESGMDIDSPPTLPAQPMVNVEAEIV